MRGIGTDIIEIKRIAQAIEREAFLLRVYTEGEQRYIKTAANPAQSAAGIFCAKEAVAKALGTGFGAMLPLKAIEVIHTEAGAPKVCLRKRVAEEILLSISHCRDYATATAVVWEG